MSKEKEENQIAKFLKSKKSKDLLFSAEPYNKWLRITNKEWKESKNKKQDE